MTSWKTETFKVTELARLITDKKILIPQYQRGQIWNSQQKASLIDSIKHGYPFGTILLFKQSEQHFVLIDGLQRSSTIHEFVNNPSQFFDKNDLDQEIIKGIVFKAKLNSGDPQLIEKVESKIINWVKSLKTMDDVVTMQFSECVDELAESFPTIKSDTTISKEIVAILKPTLQSYINNCKNLVDAEIPAIVYTGDDGNLPLIFERINSQGTKLNKYQIFAATWSASKHKIESNSLYEIIDYVKEHFDELISKSFNINDYNPNVLEKDKTINLYQLLYGYGKMISVQYKNLFKSNNGVDVESIGFNLVNACLLNDNNKMKNLPSRLKEHFSDDLKINKLLERITESCTYVSNLLKPLTDFKLNGRNDLNSKRYHTEMQICSMIASVFLSRYSTFKINEDGEILNLSFDLDHSNEDWNKLRGKFKNQAIKTYVHDILSKKWSGTGDKKLDEIIRNKNYYISDINQDTMKATIGSWIEQTNNRKEMKKVAEPTIIDKLLLSVIYKSKFTAEQQLDGSYYDIEHLIPKDLMKTLLAACNASEGLPISSFANICLLPEFINRKKKQKTLYQDNDYLKALNAKSNIDLNKLERKYTFTSETSMNWVDIENLSFDDLSEKYMNFLKNRKLTLIEEIMNGLGN